MNVNLQLAEEIGRICEEAGSKIMRHYVGARRARFKQDASPVTDADMEAHHHIVAALSILAPGVPIISEEDETLLSQAPEGQYWLVDPLDGTRGFVSGEGEFTVNIGLIEGQYPILGAIYIPRQNLLFYGAQKIGAYRQEKDQPPVSVNARRASEDGLTVVKSSQHSSEKMEQFLSRFQISDVTSASSSVKFCTLAEGEADIYPRLGRTMEWDTAAGQAILEAAGGRVETLDGARFYYGKPGFENPGFVAFGA